MYMPLVTAPTGKIRRQVVAFGGLNRARDARAGELADSVGLSGREWPCLGQRRPRSLVDAAPDTDALFAWDKLVTARAGRLYYGEQDMGAVAPGKKQFAVVNGKLCIFPDKKYLDLAAPQGKEPALRDLGVRVDTMASSVLFGEDFIQLRAPHSILGTYRLYKSGGVEFLDGFHFKVYAMEDLRWDAETGWGSMPYVEKTAWQLKKGDCLMLPWSSSREDRPPDYQVDTHGNYAQTYDQWGDFMYLTQDVEFIQNSTGSASYFVVEMERRNAAGMNQSFLGRGFRIGDMVTISGCETLPDNNIHLRLLEIWEDKLVFERPDPEIPVFLPGEEKGAVTFERFVPALDFVCAVQGRLFGARSDDNTVYASALGDPTNFAVYEGLDTDSYIQTAGTDGPFTGCVAYGGGALFFKEDCIVKLMGSRPANYELYTYQVAGLQSGSEGSLAIIDEVLYYKGKEGVYAYTGSTPKLVSAALGGALYADAVAGSDGRRYYISMENRETGVWELLVYDTRTGLWLKEEERQATGFAALGDTLYMLSEDAVYALDRAEGDEGQPIAWEALFVPFNETVHERKYPSRLLLRLELDRGAWVEAWLSRDGGPFQNVWTSHDRLSPTALIPIRPGRCDSYQLRLKGEGKCLIKSLEREFSLGGVR